MLTTVIVLFFFQVSVRLQPSKFKANQNNWLWLTYAFKTVDCHMCLADSALSDYFRHLLTIIYNQNNYHFSVESQLP